jgi:Raf kinase inhibitor-like YbhB/YbcL family protein
MILANQGGCMLHVSSSAFADGQPIPQKYSCDGENVSPPLEWEGVPDSARSLAILCDDPDAPAGTFTHWVLYDIPAGVTRLSEGAANIGEAGLNDFGKVGYGGPCPPHKDGAHRYFFHVYALDVASLGKSRLSKSDFAKAIKGHVLSDGKLAGKYERKENR